MCFDIYYNGVPDYYYCYYYFYNYFSIIDDLQLTSYAPAYVVDVRAMSSVARFLHCTYATSSDRSYVVIVFTGMRL